MPDVATAPPTLLSRACRVKNKPLRIIAVTLAFPSAMWGALADAIEHRYRPSFDLWWDMYLAACEGYLDPTYETEV